MVLNSPKYESSFCHNQIAAASEIKGLNHINAHIQRPKNHPFNVILGNIHQKNISTSGYQHRQRTHSEGGTHFEEKKNCVVE